MTWGIRSAKAEPLSTHASATVRVAVAVLLACLGLAWQAQAAHATYGKVTIVKINEGGNQADAFTFQPQVVPSIANFSIKAGEASRKTFSVECNVDRAGKSGECARWGYPSLKVTELATAGYKLKSIVCRHTQGTKSYAGEPTTSSALDSDTTIDLANRRVSLKVSWYEWVKCYVTNAKLRPRIEIDKSGPATAVAGDLVPYRLEVSNPGPVAFDEDAVKVTDAACQTTPALASKGADATPGSLDPGDTWVYACAVQTQVGQTIVENVARVEAIDAHGCKATDSDDATTELTQPLAPPAPAPQQPQPRPQGPDPQPEVVQASGAPPTVSAPGSARLRGPSGCTTRRAVTAMITGRRIVKVTFYLDGRKVRTLTRPDARGRWKLPISLSRLPFGAHELRARVQFAQSSGTSTRTLRLRFSRCQQAAPQPHFTG